MSYLDIFLVVATVVLILHILILGAIGIGVWRLVNSTTALLHNTYKSIQSIKEKVGDATDSGVAVANMVTQGAMSIGKLFSSSNKKHK